jgi:hypothetical protein
MSFLTTYPTGFHDKHGIPIHSGDLIRVFHFTHYMRRRKMYLYFRVGINGERWVVRNWHDLDESKWQCLLEHCGIESAEVLASNEKTDVMFNERKRVEATE